MSWEGKDGGGGVGAGRVGVIGSVGGVTRHQSNHTHSHPRAHTRLRVGDIMASHGSAWAERAGPVGRPVVFAAALHSGEELPCLRLGMELWTGHS